MTGNPAPMKVPRIRGDHEHVDRISTQTTIVVLAVIILLLHAIQWVILPFVAAGLVAFICTPLIEGLTRRTPLPRILWATLVFLALITIMTVIGWLGVPPLMHELTYVVTEFDTIIRNGASAIIGPGQFDLFGQHMDATEVARSVVTGLRNWIGQADRLAILGGLGFASLFGTMLAAVLLFYFLASGPAILRGLLWMVPPKQRPLIRHIWTRLEPVLRRYFIGVLVVIAYATVAAYIGLGVVLGLQHAVVLALMTGLLEMIPVVGPGAAAIIAGLVAIRYATGIGSIIAYALYATALRLSIDQLLGPIALGAAARVHPVLIMFCFLVGGLLFGVTGVIMAVPVAIITKVTLMTLYDEPAEAQ
jgi:predicted PurR-regulated permease PerM